MKFALYILFISPVFSMNAFVALLSSNDYLVPAKVLALSLRRHNNTAPLVVLCVEDITEPTKQSLREFGVTTMDVKRLANPEAEKYTEKKLQYTKLHMWEMTNYTSLVFLDLDMIAVADLSDLFRCGAFCVVMRHSDMFNSGMFAMRPSAEVYKDMQAKHGLPTYDHGDQGFLNSYFAEVKFARMFDPEDEKWPKDSKGIYRLPFSYNYDVGMYYLQSRMLVEPKIIHYTLGPTKPWIWWTYPMFDLHWKWLELRNSLPNESLDIMFDLSYILFEAVLFSFLFGAYKLSKISAISLANHNTEVRTQWLIVLLLNVSLFISFFLVPSGKGPDTSWGIFVGNQMILLLFFNAVRVQLFEECSLSYVRIVQYFIAGSLSFLLVYKTLASVPVFGTRCKVMLLLVPAWYIFMAVLCKRLRNGNGCKLVRYELVNKA